MGDAIAGVVEWGLRLFSGVKKELDNVGVSGGDFILGCHPQLANAWRSPADSESRVAPDMKLLHTHQHEERLRAMARYGEYLLIRQNNAAKVATVGEELVARRKQGFGRKIKGTRQTLATLKELRFKIARDEERMQHYEDRVAVLILLHRHTGCATFTGVTFGQGSSKKGDVCGSGGARRAVVPRRYWSPPPATRSELFPPFQPSSGFP